MIDNEKINKELSIEAQIEVNDFINFLIDKEKKRTLRNKRPYGLCKGEIIMSDDFTDPMDENTLKEWGIL